MLRLVGRGCWGAALAGLGLEWRRDEHESKNVRRGGDVQIAERYRWWCQAGDNGWMEEEKGGVGREKEGVSLRIVGRSGLGRTIE